MGTILAIDPGNTESGYVLVEHDGKEIRKVLDVGKVPNGEIFPVLCREYQHLAIEMVAGMGMPVGQEVLIRASGLGGSGNMPSFTGRDTRYRRSSAGKKSFTYAAERRRRMRTSDKPSSTATRPESRTTAREQRRTPVSFTASRRTCGRLWR